MRCDLCGEEKESFQLQRCPSCRGSFCEGCGLRFQGMRFCNQTCAQIFFHGDAEDEDDLGREDD